MAILVAATAVAVAAGDTPAGAVLALYRDAAAGDVAAIARAAKDGNPRAVAVLLNKARSGCVQFRGLQVRIGGESDGRVTAHVDGWMVSWHAASPAVRVERHRAVIVLRAGGGAWRVESFRLGEDVLADELAAAPLSERRDRLRRSEAEVTPQLAAALATRVVARMNEAKLAEAGDLQRLASDVAEETGDPAALANALSVRGMLQRHTGALGDSVATLRAALDLAEQSGDPDVLARCLVRLFRSEAAAGQLDVTRLRRVLAMADQVEDPATISMAASALARAEDDGGHQREAFRLALLARRHALASGDAAAIVSAETNLAGAHFNRGDCPSAMPHIEAAVRHAEEAGFSTIAASVLHWKNDCLLAAGRHDEFERSSDRALEMAANTARGADSLVDLLVARARHSTDRQRLDEAECYLQRAGTVLSRCGPAVGGCLEALWSAESRLRLRQDRPQEALEAATLAGDSLHAAQALRRLGRLDEARTELEKGIAHYEFIRARISSARARSLFFGRLAPLYAELVSLEFDAANPLGSFAAADRMRSRVIAEIRSHGIAGELSPAERGELAALDRSIEALNQRLLAAGRDRAQRERVRQELAAARRRLDAFHARTDALAAHRPPERSPVRLPALRPGHAVLMYTITEERTFLFILTPAGGKTNLRATSIAVRASELAAEVARYRLQVDRRDGRWKSTARSLYRLLLAPAARELAGATTLAVMPDADLWTLPFQTLSNENGQTLVETHAVSYALTSDASRGGDSRPHTGRPPLRLLALANPAVSYVTESRVREVFRGDLGPLTDAEEEVEEVARLYETHERKVYVGADARESVFKREAADAAIVHLATHGLVDPADPMYSAILLASADAGEDGLLEARELARMPLRAELAVLSACDTARGEVRPGEGLIGLSWAILATGCRNAVVSQWRAASKATARLMVEFHRHYAKSRKPAEALRRAALELKSNPRYEDPIYWAPFIVLGED